VGLDKGDRDKGQSASNANGQEGFVHSINCYLE